MREKETSNKSQSPFLAGNDVTILTFPGLHFSLLLIQSTDQNWCQHFVDIYI